MRSLIVAGILIASASAATADDLRPLRMEVVGAFHYGGGAQAEWAFPLADSAVALDFGASYGIRDWWNSVSAGTTYYWGRRADGPFVQLQEVYGYGVVSVQGDDGVDWKTVLAAGYRWMVLDWLTASVSAGVNYDSLIVAPRGGSGDFNAGAQKGFNPAVSISVGVALDPAR
jgi:hypothetical protein